MMNDVNVTQSAATFDRSKTLQELEGAWPPPNHASCLVQAIYRLRTKPLKEFSSEDLRIMIVQNIALDYLVPLALEHLSEDPLVAGDYYRGDLLKSVLTVEPKFWDEHPDLWRWTKEVLVELEILRKGIDESIMPAARMFRTRGPEQSADSA